MPRTSMGRDCSGIGCPPLVSVQVGLEKLDLADRMLVLLALLFVSGQLPPRICCMTTVRVKENEPFDVALRRFKRTVEKTGLLTELRAREFYEKPTWERKRKLAAAVKRHYKRIRSQTLPPKLY